VRDGLQGIKIFNSYKFYLIIASILAIFLIGAVYFLNDAINGKKRDMQEKIAIISTMIEKVAKFDAIYSSEKEFQFDTQKATLFQIKQIFFDMDSNLEYLLAKVIDGKIIFQAHSKAKPNDVKVSDVHLAIPMRKALNNEMGVIVDSDYVGKKVFAAYSNVKGTDWGLVIKQPYFEYVLPLIYKGLFSFIAFASFLTLIFFYLREQDKNQRELEKSHDELNKHKSFTDAILYNSSHAIITTDTKGMITSFNKKAEEIFAYDATDLISRKTFDSLYQQSEINFRSKEYSKKYGVSVEPGFETFIAKTELGYQNEEVWTYGVEEFKEKMIQLKVTKLIDVQSKYTIGYLIIAEDISLKVEKDRKLKEFVKLIDHNVITSSTDLEGNITKVSKKFCKISEYEPQELLGKNHRVIRHEDTDPKVFKELWKTISDGKVWNGEIKNRTKSGGFYWVDVTISPVYDAYDRKIGYTAVRQDITDRKHVEEISITDALTGIYNRRHFDVIFPKMINSAKRHKDFFCFVILDIDHFKQYNDNYGHQKGDETLVSVAQSIESSLKRGEDYCFRLGGEEFGVVFKVDKKEKALVFAEQIREKIESLAISHEYSTAGSNITASLGLLVQDPNETHSVDEVYKRADELLYQAKEQGRNRVISS